MGDDYNPHLFRTPANPTNNFETMLNIMKGTIGTGILAMPDGFKNSGLLSGVVSTAFIGFVVVWSLQVLVQSQYSLCKQRRVPLLKYPEAMEAAFEVGPDCLKPLSKYMPTLVNVFLLTYQVGTCCVYVVFVAKNFKFVIDGSLEKPIAVEIYILGSIIPFTLILFVRNLKLLAPVSAVATVIALITFCVVAYYLVRGLPPISEVPMIAHPIRYPLYFGTTLFALLAIGVVVTNENNMKRPQDFWWVIDVAMIFVIFLYIFIGFMGYWRYGEDTLGSVTLNLPQEDALVKVIDIAYSISMFATYGVQGYVAFDILWFDYWLPKLEESEYKVYWEYLSRVIVVLMTYILACTVPLLGLVISLVGAFCLAALGIMFPAMMEFCVQWQTINVFTIIKDGFLFVFGLFGLIVGTETALYEIIMKLKEGKYDN